MVSGEWNNDMISERITIKVGKKLEEKTLKYPVAFQQMVDSSDLIKELK